MSKPICKMCEVAECNKYYSSEYCVYCIPKAAEIRNKAIEEAAAKTIEKGKSVKGGYNNAAHSIAEEILKLKSVKKG